MAFPTTGILDSFTGADENPIATNWSSGIVNGEAGGQRLSNAFTGGSAAWGGSYYDLADYGPNVECFVKVPTLPADGETISTWARVTNPGGASAGGYQVKYVHSDPGPGFMEIMRMTGGSTFVSLGTAGLTLAAGDGIGIYCYDDQIEGWEFDGASWTLQLGPFTDATHADAGKIGLEVFNTVARLGDFGGGSVVAAPGDTGVLFVPSIYRSGG